MQNIVVFYHLFIPPDQRATMWTWWVDEQISLLKSSKLADVASVQMAITMPVFWVDTNGKFFKDTVVEYINKRYPFVKILNVRDVGKPNFYEGQTLRFLHSHCLTTDGVVLYIHSKGYTSQTPQVSCWRQILNHYCIEEWTTALKKLHDHDVVGVKDAVCEPHMVSGNFWWANNEFIRRLPRPLESELYQTRESFYPGGPDYRYSFEDWLWSGKPYVYHIVDTKTDHFKDLCFLEDL